MDEWMEDGVKSKSWNATKKKTHNYYAWWLMVKLKII